MSDHLDDLSSLRIDRSKKDYGSNPEARSKQFRWIAAILLVGLIAFLIYRFGGDLLAASPEVKMTSAIMQSPSQANALLTASGYVVAQRKASIASKATGRLIQLDVVEGDPVKTDQIIARLEDNDIRARLQETVANLAFQESELREAEANFKRQQALLASGASSQAEYDAAETRYRRVQAAIKLAKAQVQTARVDLENTLIRVPFDGTVLTKNADVGEIVAPLAASANSRAAVVTIADMKSLQVEADVSEANIEKIAPGQDCEISLNAYPSRRYAGYVAKIVPTADRSKATVMVKVGFRDYDHRVLPEMSAKVLFLKNKESKTAEVPQPVLVVPESAVTSRNGGTAVFTVSNDIARIRSIETGKNFNGYIEVVNGLQDGDRVINNPSNEIEDGIKVSIQ